MPKTQEQAIDAAKIGYQVTGGKFCVIPDPDCAGYYMSIPAAEHAPGTDPAIVYQTPKGKIYYNDSQC